MSALRRSYNGHFRLELELRLNPVLISKKNTPQIKPKRSRNRYLGNLSTSIAPALTSGSILMENRASLTWVLLQHRTLLDDSSEYGVIKNISSRRRRNPYGDVTDCFY